MSETVEGTARNVEQDAEKVRQPVLFIWSVRSVWFVLFIWLNQTNRINQMNQINQINKTNQITRQTGLVPNVQAIEVRLRRNGISVAC